MKKTRKSKNFSFIRFIFHDHKVNNITLFVLHSLVVWPKSPSERFYIKCIGPINQPYFCIIYKTQGSEQQYTIIIIKLQSGSVAACFRPPVSSGFRLIYHLFLIAASSDAVIFACGAKTYKKVISHYQCSYSQFFDISAIVKNEIVPLITKKVLLCTIIYMYMIPCNICS